MNNSAIAKLSWSKALHFVVLSSSCICPPWDQGALYECWVVACYSLVIFFLFPAKGYWTTNTRGMFKEFWRNFIFALRLVVHIHALRKIKLKGWKAMDPRVFAIILFHHFFQERDILFFQRVFISVHQIFIFSENSNKARIKLHERQGAFWQNTHRAPWKVICASFVYCAFFWSASWALVTSKMSLVSGLTLSVWSLPCRG